MKYHVVPVCSKGRFAPSSFRTISLGKGIRATIGCRRGQFRKGRCRAGTAVQRLLVPKSMYTFRQAKAFKRKRFGSCRL